MSNSDKNVDYNNGVENTFLYAGCNLRGSREGALGLFDICTFKPVGVWVCVCVWVGGCEGGWVGGWVGG